MSFMFTISADISIHSLRMEGDLCQCCDNVASSRFQSTPSAWRETRFRISSVKYDSKFQSTPSAWRETLCFSTFFAGFYISIHSLRMEGDPEE